MENKQTPGMTGWELLQWLKEIPEEELKHTEVLLDTAGYTYKLIVPHYYRGEGIYLIDK